MLDLKSDFDYSEDPTISSGNKSGWRGARGMLQVPFTQRGCLRVLFSFWFVMVKGQSSLGLDSPTPAPAWKRKLYISFLLSEWKGQSPLRGSVSPKNPHNWALWSLRRMVLSKHYRSFSFFFLLHGFFSVHSFDPLSCAYGLFYLSSFKIEVYFWHYCFLPAENEKNSFNGQTVNEELELKNESLTPTPIL